MHDTITGPVFQEMLIFGATSIAKEKQSINDLNVFPVPDGDTGTNMSLTMHAAAQELQKRSPATVDLASSITASALLRGARGNSGVILSLLFRGMSKSLKGCVTADGCTFAAAMQEGVSAAYNAVMKPAEGTILTVSRLAADRAMGRRRPPSVRWRPPARRTTPSSYWTRPSRPATPPWRRPSR